MDETRDDEALKASIRSVVRGGVEQDSVRALIISRAAELTASDLIPGNWNPDGSLADARAWTAEQRDTANDAFTALDGALTDAYDGSYYVWVQDWYGGADDDPYTVVYYFAGDIWATTFDVDDTGKYVVAVGDARKVRPCTTYIDRGAAKNENRSIPKSVEWRQQRADALKGVERRARVERFEVRTDDTGTHFTGYASLTDQPYDMGWYSETIARGAFKKTLAENPDVTLLLNHGGLPLARTKAGTLRLSEDGVGLRVEADLDADDPDSQTLARKMARGDLDGQMSFAFQATRQSWNDDYSQRSINEVNINRGDVSVVTQGASPNTFSSLRADDALMALRHLGPIGFLESMLDLRRFAALPKEQRVGKALSASTQEVLTQVLNLCSVADDAMDQAQPILAELMGVQNPDEDDDTPPPDDDPDERAADVSAIDNTARSDDLAREMRARMAKYVTPRRNVA